MFFTKKSKKTEDQIHKTKSELLVSKYIQDARHHFKVGNHTQALQACQEALNIDATNADAYRLRGVIRYQLHDLAGAATDVQRSLDINDSLTQLA